VSPAPGTLARRRVTVTGVVQGVGFRPFVYRLADELALHGFVGNDPAGVFIEVEGPEDALDEFEHRLVTDAPRLARIDAMSATSAAPVGVEGFRIVDSVPGGGARTLVPADVATCDDCLAELFDPRDRRYRYPFTNCTSCGPRFTIIRDLPYDRPLTTMAGFELCAPCAAEYHDPRDRRYHAQPVACPACGPRIAFERGGSIRCGTDPVLAAVHAALSAGEVIAIKGIGGYHLACDATSDAAVARLRERKGRGDKPFAVMVPGLDAARRLAFVDDTEALTLVSTARPIVLLRRRPDARVATNVAPGNPLIGVMLPYSPLHHLLFAPVPGGDVEPPLVVVLTSGNVTDEPICTGNDEARARLAGLADAFVSHDRPIHVPCDDSVVRIVDGVEQPIRRSRGYAPLPVRLPVDVAPTLAVGGELKNAFCLASGRQAWLSQHVGDMENLETLGAFGRSVEQFESMYEVTPSVLAADRHPGYVTRRWAHEHAAWCPVVEVQHHHAHIASVMAENGLDGASAVIGVAFDGTGYGVDASGAASIWGGEVLIADYERFERAGHLGDLPLPGGDGAVRNPCRIALAYLAAVGVGGVDDLPPALACDATERRIVARQVERNVGCVPTSSMGRLFDAVSSLLDVRHRASYEAQAAIELEALAERAGGVDPVAMRFGIGPGGVIDPSPVLGALVDGWRAGADRAALASGFHLAVARAVVDSAVTIRSRAGLTTLALSGGVFQNALLTRLVREGARAEGFDVITHRVVPPNDGGLALGQAVIAGYRRR